MQRFICLEKSFLGHILAYFTVAADFIEKSVDSVIIFIIKRLEFGHFFCSSLILLFFTEKLLCLYRVQGKGYRGHLNFLSLSGKKLLLCLADFRVFGAETDYPLPFATLFPDFSESKKSRSKECKQKIFAAQTPPRKRGYVEDFTLKSVNALNKIFFSSTAFYQSNRIATTVRPCNLRQNRRATGARMGLVSKHRLVDIMLDFYAMSRCGLRKPHLRLKSTILTRYFTVNRTRFSAQLAVAR